MSSEQRSQSRVNIKTLLIAAAASGQTVRAWINQLADRESRKILAELEHDA